MFLLNIKFILNKTTLNIHYVIIVCLLCHNFDYKCIFLSCYDISEMCCSEILLAGLLMTRSWPALLFMKVCILSPILYLFCDACFTVKRACTSYGKHTHTK